MVLYENRISIKKLAEQFSQVFLENLYFLQTELVFYRLYIVKGPLKNCFERKSNMSLFSNNTHKPKTLINTGRADLRRYTAEALQKIKAINAGVVLLPKDASPEFMAAYGGISKNAGSERYLSKDDDIVSVSGVTEFNCQTAKSNAFYDVSGITVLTHCKTENPVKIMLSGICIYEKDNNIQFEDLSGISCSVDFGIEHVIIFSKDVKIGNKFLNEVKDNTVVLCGKDLIFESDVDENMFNNRNIYFLAGKSIICSKKIIGIIQTVASAGKEIAENGKQH